MSTGALKGLRVLDLAMGVAGPHAAFLCAQHGADVVKIETIAGDWGRVLGKQYGDLSAFSTVYNRGKRSVALDLKDEEARAIVARAAESADVIVEAFRPGVMKRFGLDYESVKARNPGVIYVSVTGFGQTGPMSDLPATDAVMQAFSGFMHLNKNEQGEPQRVDMILIDVITGLYGFQAITTAIIERQTTGKGKYVDCSLLKSAICFQAPKIVENVLEGGVQVMYVPLGVVPTRDGHLSISVMHDHHFVSLCEALGRSDFGTDPRYDTRLKRVTLKDEVMDFVRAEFRKHTTADLSKMLTEKGVLHSVPLKYPELLAHPQTATVDAITWVKQDGIEMDVPLANVPGAPKAEATSSAPHVGQHSLQVLKEWGVSPAVIDSLVTRGAVSA